MNLLLLEPHELGSNSRIVLTDRRAGHLRTVLRVTPGRELRIGVVDGAEGRATVVAVDDESVEIECALQSEVPVRSEDTLVLAVPRPKVLQRMLEHAAALGFGRIVLFRTWRVDKSHLDAKILRPEMTRQHLLAGLEQSRRTRLPEVHFFPLFKPFVEDVLSDLVPRGHRYVAHPTSGLTTASLRYRGGGPFTLALGPEGGFIPYEVDALQGRGFVPITLGLHPLRNESALSVLHGQLDLLRRLAR